MRHCSPVVLSRAVAMVVTLLGNLLVRWSVNSGVQQRSGDQSTVFDPGVSSARQWDFSNDALWQGGSWRFAMRVEMEIAVQDRDVVLILRSEDESKATRRCFGGLVA